MGPLIDLFLSIAFIQKVQQGEIISIPAVKRFVIESEGLFLIDTGASNTLEDFDLLRFSLNAPPGRLKDRSRAS